MDIHFEGCRFELRIWFQTEGSFNMVKNNLNIARRFEPASYWVVPDVTTELQDSIRILTNTTYLIKTIVIVLLARPAFNNSSAGQSKWAAIFPQKATTTVCIGFCINPSSKRPSISLRIFPCTVIWAWGFSQKFSLNMWVNLYSLLVHRASTDQVRSSRYIDIFGL